VIDYGKDTHTYSDSDTDQDRWGLPKSQLIHDGGLTTDIDWRNQDYSGRKLSPSMRRTMNRLRTQHQRTRIKDAIERNLVVALAELQRLASRMDLPLTIRTEAARFYRKAVDNKLVRGRSIEGVVAASLYLACRMLNQPRTLDEVGHHSRTGRKEIGRTYRAIVKELKLQVPSAEPKGYVPRFCATLKLPAKASLESNRIIEACKRDNHAAGRGPTGIAAAAVYLAAMLVNQPRTQREVAMAAGVTEVTIRNRYKEMCATMKLDPDNPAGNN
jgi:transcription initiation factor TFIIB